MTHPDSFDAWWNSEPHRLKYPKDHPAYLAGREAWLARGNADWDIVRYHDALSNAQGIEVANKIKELDHE